MKENKQIQKLTSELEEVKQRVSSLEGLVVQLRQTIEDLQKKSVRRPRDFVGSDLKDRVQRSLESEAAAPLDMPKGPQITE